MQLDARTAEEWCNQLHNGFLRSCKAPAAEIVKYAPLFDMMEALVPSTEVLRKTGLYRDVERVSRTRRIPRDEEFHFKARAKALVKKWDAVLHPRPEIPTFAGQTKPLPFEILRTIIAGNIDYLKVGFTSSSEFNRRQWRKEVDHLLACLFVARDWSMATKDVIYKGKIRLRSVEDVTLFLRTVQEDLETPCPVRHLCFINSEQLGPRDPELEHRANEYRRIASIIIPHCSQMQYLEAELSALSFSPDIDLPGLPNLGALLVVNQGLLVLAPLLTHLPNLKMFAALNFGDSGLNADNTHPPLDTIPMPSFCLRELRLAQSDLTLAGCNWLLSNSRNMDLVELQDIPDNFEALATVMHDSVLSLHIKGAVDNPQTGSDELAGLVPRFERLTSLRISGSKWPWESLLRNIDAPLKSISISYSKPGTTHLASRLNDASWLPKLETVTVYHWADVDRFYGLKAVDINNDRRTLDAACAGRQVDFVWITEGESWSDADGEGGATMGDLV